MTFIQMALALGKPGMDVNSSGVFNQTHADQTDILLMATSYATYKIGECSKLISQWKSQSNLFTII